MWLIQKGKKQIPPPAKRKYSAAYRIAISKRDPKNLSPLRHLVRVVRRHEITISKTMAKINTMTGTNENTLKERFWRLI